jgi:ankyrin repeat protein
MLIFKGANINQQDDLGFSSIHHAALNNNFEATKILIQNENINLDVSNFNE